MNKKLSPSMRPERQKGTHGSNAVYFAGFLAAFVGAAGLASISVASML
jgi:hypothetical protein